MRNMHYSEGYCNSPAVSVIIPSRNSERTITDCLSSIISQSYEPIEIIVVDCLSTDLTREIAQRMGALVISSRGERSVAKNLGAEFAHGKYLFFVDADHKLSADVIANCTKTIDGVDGVLITDQDIATDSKVSRLIASRREVFDSVGGFDPDLYADEDLDFHRRFLKLGFKMAYSRATEWHMGSPVNLKGLLNRSLYYSSNHVTYASRNPLIAFSRISPLRVVAAWKKSNAPASDLLPVVLLGFLSNAFLMIGFLLNLNRRQGTQKVDLRQTALTRNKATPSKKNVIDNCNKEGKN